MTPLNPKLCKLTRETLGWSHLQLADAAGVARQTVVDFERGVRIPYPNNLAAIRFALQAVGVEFTNGDAPGVRLRKAPDILPADPTEPVPSALGQDSAEPEEEQEAK